MSDNQIANIVERVQRLQEEKRMIEDDIKEVYAEARANGYDVKVLRAVVKHLGKDQDEAAEFDAIFDLYLSAVKSAVSEATGARRATPAIARTVPAKITPQENDDDGNREQRFGRADDEQRDAARVPRALGRREGDDESAQGQGPGSAGDDRDGGSLSRVVDRQDQDRGSRHVGGEAHHSVDLSEIAGASTANNSGQINGCSDRGPVVREECKAAQLGPSTCDEPSGADTGRDVRTVPPSIAKPKAAEIDLTIPAFLDRRIPKPEARQ